MSFNPEDIGITQQQSDVYQKLLENGPSSVNELTRLLEISRISCYDTLNRLLTKGLVSFENARAHRLYKAVDPERLLLLAKEQTQKAQQKQQHIEQALPALKALAKSNVQNNQSTTYVGKEGAKTFFELVLSKRAKLQVIGATGKALKELQYYFPHWHEQRIKRSIILHLICNEEVRNDPEFDIKKATVKFLPKEYTAPATIFIFGDHVANLVWQDNPLIFVIESQDITKSYKQYFSLLWKQAKQV